MGKQLGTLLILSALTACSGPAAPTVYGQFPGDDSVAWKKIGHSVEGRSIYAAEFGGGTDTTVVFGGFHGNEKASIEVALELCRMLAVSDALVRTRRVIVVPLLNPDGYAENRRHNSNGVDLNRNLPTGNWGDSTLRRGDNPGPAPASEPETQAAMDILKRYRPTKILSLHSPYRMNNYDGEQSRALALAMALYNRYPVKGYIGYPTPGSLGTWAGIERSIPCVTLEIPNGDGRTRWNENKWALIAAIRHPPPKS